MSGKHHQPLSLYDGTQPFRISCHAHQRFAECGEGLLCGPLDDEIANGRLFGRPSGLAVSVRLPCGLIAIVAFDVNGREYVVATVLTRRQHDSNIRDIAKLRRTGKIKKDQNLTTGRTDSKSDAAKRAGRKMVEDGMDW